jgi:hypothetical protein
MFALTNTQLTKSILTEIEDQLIVVSSQLPESLTESARSQALLQALPEIVQDIVEDRG